MDSKRLYLLLSLVYYAAGNINNSSDCYSPESCLYNYLMSLYNNQVRPVTGPSGVVNVTVDVELINILSLDEKNEVLHSVLAINVLWNDEFLGWNKTDYPVDVILLNTKELWLPDLTIVNVVDSFFKRTYLQDFRAYIASPGDVLWYFGGIFSTTCPLNIKRYPFDTQTCSIVIQNWAYLEDLVNLTSITLTTKYFTNNSLWDLTDTSTYRESYEKEPGIVYPKMTITLTLKRKTTYYVLNIILPCSLITLVALVLFWLPSECGEKISLGISVLLAYTVFEIVIMDITPVNSDEVPFLSGLVLFIMILSTVSILTSILTTYLHYKKPFTRPPKWLHYFALKILARPINAVDATSNKDLRQETILSEDGNYKTKKTDDVDVPSKNQELSLLVDELQVVTSYIKEMKENEAITDEWKAVATVIDRILFFVVVITLIIIIPVLILT